ncbi:asparaginase [Bacillus atrophaeus]|nr:asparaginase [Bacillus atrophaeus]MEC1730679.1 asparaginase [Bacillus atrophaeus]MEC2360021.1 asparaginase [Bacillus atrophaeus]WQP46555.1 asparaginase [Bacillus atrophaeus]
MEQLQTYRHTTETAFDVRLINELSKVSIIYAHQGDDRYLYDAAVQAGAKGIVVATAGGYTISKQAEAGIHDALKGGFRHTVISTQYGNC